MTTAFAAQLGQIAAASTNELDLNAQKAAHSQSLIFERKIAGSQDFETIYQICLEGFQDLCELDQRFTDFQRNIFNPQSKDQDRTQMTAQENEALDSVLEEFLCLVGSRLLLRPAVKALEWLVRRFNVHTSNTSWLITTFLPYHDTSLFRNLLSILPKNLPVQYKFLGPYLQSATNPPRHAITYCATNSDPFFATLCSYTMQSCRESSSYPLLLAFWTSITTEAVTGKLALAQSGRREVQTQRQEDVLLKVLPVLSDGFALEAVPEMVLACYTVAVIIANKVDLSDEVIDSLMEAVALSLSTKDQHSGIVCLSILAGRKRLKRGSKKLLGSVIGRSDFTESLRSVDETHSVSGLVQALSSCAIQSLKKKNYVDRIQFVLRIATSTKWHTHHVTSFLRDVLHAIAACSKEDAVKSAIRVRLIDLLQQLYRSERFAEALGRSAVEIGMTQTDLKSLLGQVTTGVVESAPLLEEVEEMEVDGVSDSQNSLEKVFLHVPGRTVAERSFLMSTDSPLFGTISDAYLASYKELSGGAQFRALPIWHTETENCSLLYVTFLLRIASGKFPDACRAAALRSITLMIEEQVQTLDSQALLVYIIPRLADSAQSVRRAASETIIAMQAKAPRDILEAEESRPLGAEYLYDTEQMPQVRWMAPSDLATVLRQGFLPTLEECVADQTHVTKIVHEVLLGSAGHFKAGHKHRASDFKELRKVLRHELFECLHSHVVATPLLAVKIEMIALLKDVEKVASSHKITTLRPTVQAWGMLSDKEAAKSASKEGLEVAEVDSGMAKLVNSSEKDAACSLLNLVTDLEELPRKSFVDAVFGHFKSNWTQMTPESRAMGSQKLIDLSLSNSAFSERSRDALSSIQLPGEALARVLYAAFAAAPEVNGIIPSRKRRRSSSGTKPSNSALNSMTSHMTLALELIHGSEPENHLDLLPGLFEALSRLQTLRRSSQRDFPYLLNLCLSSLLAIISKNGQAPKLKKDLSAVRIELVTDCIRQTDSPQVQNVAILLSAELARVVPEKILHNAMSIFTYLGDHGLAKDDKYSVYVVNQAIDHIIPSLLRTLQAQKKDVFGAISDLLSSFSAAFEHVAQHRRYSLFQRLISKLGTLDVLNTLLAMLMLRNNDSAEVGTFVTSLIEGFDLDVQLQTLNGLLCQTILVIQGNTHVVKVLKGTDVVDADTITATSHAMIATVEKILKATSFRARLKGFAEVSVGLESTLLGLLKLVMQVVRETAESEVLATAVEPCMEAFLNLVPMAEFFGLNARLLKDKSWQQEALQILEIRLFTAAATKDKRSREAGLALLTTLTSLVGEDTRDAVKHGAIRCMDRITELYGRRDTSAIIQAVSALSTSPAITADKPGLQTITLLCLASMLDCVQEHIIPVVPKVMSLSLAALKHSLVEGAEDDRLHDAGYALISAIISNVAFMISESDLDQILQLSAESANTEFGQKSHNVRKDALALLSRKMEVKYIVSSLHRTWPAAIENDVDAATQALDILSQSIKRAAKSSVVALADQISDYFTQVLDLRRVQFTQRDEDSYSEADVSSVEDKVNSVAIEVIYKLNDAVFRPLFTQWLEWAVKCSDVPATQLQSAKLHRQTSIYRFIAHFFGTLKSIVTSYATHALPQAVEIMQSAASLASPTSTKQTTIDLDQRVLLAATLDMIAEACKYDQDSLFASPAHFPALAESLVALLNLASSSDAAIGEEIIQAHVLPALVALAFATADTTAHHQTLNHHICQLRRSEVAGVRMASIAALHALVDSEDVGEEWVRNVVQGGAGGGGGGGETMVYVNEMLEDDDEGVEREVRRWVRRVREMVGEEVFEV